VICFLWYAESTRQVVEQKRAHGRFRQNTALQCSHPEDTTFLYCDFRFQALFYAFQKNDTLGLDDNLTAEICWNRRALTCREIKTETTGSRKPPGKTEFERHVRVAD
jgi:hypothetical protein